MTKKALRELRGKVAAGERGDGLNTSSVFGDNNGPAMLAVEAFDGSLDAAIELLEAVLPDWWALIGTSGQANIGPPKGVEMDQNGSVTMADLFHAEADTPARALLLATLEALIERAE